MRLNTAIAAAVAAGALLLAGCSSDTPAEDSAASASPSVSAEATDAAAADPAASPEPTYEATVEAEVMEQLNAADGQVIIPGSIESTTQQLGAECTTAVEPLRAIMAKYESGFSVPVAEKGAMVEELNKARAACEAVSAQEWADFYANEFAGWLYEKVEQ